MNGAAPTLSSSTRAWSGLCPGGPVAAGEDETKRSPELLCCWRTGVEEGELKTAAAQASSSKTKESLPLSPADGTSHPVCIGSPELDLSVDESLGDLSAELRTLGQDMAHCLLVLEGKCFGNPVSVLVDSGATDVFCSQTLC